MKTIYLFYLTISKHTSYYINNKFIIIISINSDYALDIIYTSSVI
jgi:hypothetical protein